MDLSPEIALTKLSNWAYVAAARHRKGRLHALAARLTIFPVESFGPVAIVSAIAGFTSSRAEHIFAATPMPNAVVKR